MCLASELLGAATREGTLELNASDERGIDVVRSQIKMFATKKVALPPACHKLVILDEADSMTAGAQQALRRIMEVHAGTTRFALACNNSSKIIEPIQSRCAILRYGRLSGEQILARLLHVCAAEGVRSTPEGLEALLFTADGDMRQALNNLQSTHAGFGFVSPENVYRVCDSPHPALVEAILLACLRADMEGAQDGLAELCALGYAAVDIIATFFRVAKMMPRERLAEPVQLEFIKQIGTVHMRILEGVTSRLQLAGLLASLCLVAAPAELSIPIGC